VPYITLIFWFVSIAGGLAIGLRAPLRRASNTKIVFAIGLALVLASIGFGHLWHYSWGEIGTAMSFVDADIPKYYWLARMCVVAYALVIGALTLHVRMRLKNP
jgi:hypothetical protein